MKKESKQRKTTVTPLQTNMQPIVTDIAGAAFLLHTTKWQIRSLGYTGQLPWFKVGKKWAFRVSDIKDFVDAQVAA